MLNSSLDSLIPTFGTMRRELERAFDDVGSVAYRRNFGMCPVSLWHTETHVYIAADVPGLTHEELEVQFDDGKLWIRGERKWKDDQPKFEHNERYFGRFERVIALSDVVDPSSVDATLENGVLLISVCKRPEAQPRMIQIRNGNGSVRQLADKSEN